MAEAPIYNELLDESRDMAPLNPKIWGHLPEDLVECVRAHLPVDAFVRTLSINKTWRSICSTSSYERLRVEDRQGNTRAAYYIMGLNYGRSPDNQAKSTPAYHAPSRQWHLMPTLSNQTQLKCRRTLAIEGGLHVVELQNACLLVCNLITRETRPIPAIGDSYDLCSLVVAEDLGSYKIFVFKVMWAPTPSMRVFDSTTNVWEELSLKVPPRLQWEGIKVVCMGVLYFVAFDRIMAGDGFTRYVRAYDLTTHTYKTVGSKLPAFIYYRRLVACKGDVILVTLDSDSPHTRRRLRVFKLTRTQQSWRRLSEMPARFYVEIVSPRLVSKLSCIGVDDKVFITNGKKLDKIIMFDVSRRSWHLIKTPERIIDKMQQSPSDLSYVGYSYTPSFITHP